MVVVADGVDDVTMEQGAATSSQLKSVEDFVADAAAAGVISDRTRQRLDAFAAFRAAASEASPPATAAEVFARSRRLIGRLAGVVGQLRERADASSRRLARALESLDFAGVMAATKDAELVLDAANRPPPPRSAAPPRAATAPAPPPVAAPAAGPAQPSRAPATAATRPAPAPPRPRLDIVAKLRDAWDTLSADFAANTLIYLGVLLSVVVIFVFFAFGYFGDAVNRPALRPPIFVATPLAFLGMAWVLRSRLQLPLAANAVGMIGALVLPIMLAALFRDGYHVPPDLAGSDRWVGYAIVGLITAVVYLALTLRHEIYAYLVAPMLWVVAGSLGLYWESGMSGPQLLTVLAVVLAGLAAASRGRATRLGRLLAVPAVRTSVAGAPFVFVLSLIFAYEDAVAAGVAAPGIADLAGPGAVAAALLAAILGVASGAGFAWDELGPRTRHGITVGLRVASYLAAGTALMLALASTASPGWLGVALIGYGVAVWLLDRMVGGTAGAGIWLARAGVAVGLALSLAEPEPALVAWLAVAVLAAARAESEKVQALTEALLPAGPGRIELWLPAMVAVAAGPVRLVPVEWIPVVLFAAAAGAVTARVLPWPELRSFATVPAAVFGATAVIAAGLIQADRSAYSYEHIGAGLLALAAIAAFTAYPWTWRMPVVVTAAAGAAGCFLFGAIEPGPYGEALIVTSVLVATGVALVLAAAVPVWREWALAHGGLGHLALYGAVLAGFAGEDALLVAMAALVLVHAVEALAVERGGVPFVDDLVDRAGSVIKQVPGVVALAGLLPLTLLAGRQAEWFRADDARLAVLLTGLAIGYAAATIRLPHTAPGVTAVALGYVSVFGSLVLAGASGSLLLVALGGGAVATLVLAVSLRQAWLSIVPWLLAFGAVYVAGAEAGLPAEAQYRPLLAAALVVVAVTASAIEWDRSRETRLGRWLIAPGAVGSIVVAVGMVAAVADDRFLWLWAAGAAVVMLGLAAAHRLGGLTVVAWAYGAIAYGDLLAERIGADPVWLLPYAAVLVGLSLTLPGRREWRLVRDPAPAALLSGLAVLGVAAAAAVAEGAPAAVLGWSALIIAAVWPVRGEDGWLHAAAAFVVGAGAAQGGGWLATALGAAAALETLLAEYRRSRVVAAAYAWLATGLWGATYASFLMWLDVSDVTVVVVTLLAGVGLSLGAAAWWWRRPDNALDDRWPLPIAVLGQAALLGAGLYASAELAEPEMLRSWSAVAAIEAILVGAAATLRRRPELAWAATGLATLSGWLLIEGLDLVGVPLVWTAGSAGVMLLAVWVLLLAAAESGTRVALWQWPALVLGQFALAAAAAGAVDGLAEPAMYGALLALAVIEAEAFVAAAYVSRLQPFAAVAAGFGVAALAAAVEWQTLGTAAVPVWLGAGAGTALLATFATRRADRPGWHLWLWALHGAAAACGLLAVTYGAILLSSEQARLAGAAVAVAAGVHALANRPLAERIAPAEILAGASFVAGAALVASVLDPADGWTAAALLAMAAGGLGAAALAGIGSGPQRSGWALGAAGLSVIALYTTAYFYGGVSVEVGYVLAVAGGALAAYAVTARQLLAFEAAIPTWLASLLILVDTRFTLGLHAAIVLVAAVVLATIEVERFRLRREDVPYPDWLRIAEWAAMAVPLTLAAGEMIVTSLGYGLLLAAEGTVLTVWGGLTQVRRRALLGVAAVTAAIVLAAAIPLVRGVQGGLTGGGWLVVGGIAAVVLITAGSVIEKYRLRVGRRLAEWGEVIEHWE